MVDPSGAPSMVISFSTFILFSISYVAPAKRMVEPEDALPMARLKFPGPGNTSTTAGFLTRILMLGFQPGPALSFNAFGILVDPKLKAPAVRLGLVAFSMSLAGLLVFSLTSKTELFSDGTGIEISYDQSNDALVKKRGSTDVSLSTIFPLN